MKVRTTIEYQQLDICEIDSKPPKDTMKDLFRSNLGRISTTLLVLFPMSLRETNVMDYLEKPCNLRGALCKVHGRGAWRRHA